MKNKNRWWFAEVKCTKTIIVQAASRKEAQAKLDAGEGEGVDVTYRNIGRPRVIRQDKAIEPSSPPPLNQ